MTKINNGTLGLEVHIILAAHRSPAARAHWEVNAFLLWENEAQSFSFLKARFDPLLKIIVCFPDCSVLSLVFSLVWSEAV